jgi:hypothetical protein
VYLCNQQLPPPWKVVVVVVVVTTPCQLVLGWSPSV